MIIGNILLGIAIELLGMKPKNVNNEVVFLFLCTLLEETFILLISIAYTVGMYLFVEETLPRLIVIVLLLIIVLGVGVVCRNTILGGIYCLRVKRWKRHKNLWIYLPVTRMVVKRESHDLSKHAGYRYHRYYLLIQWEDQSGNRHMGRSEYFYEWERNLIEHRKIQVYVNPENEHQYFCEI